MRNLFQLNLIATVSTLGLVAGAAQADQQIIDDLIVQGSICAGQDCVNGESFGFDTIRLKENNLRIKFQDTSNSASFPTNDWQLTANDSGNGGANKFSIDDITNGKIPFTVEANTPSHTLYVDSAGRIGVGTSTPVVDLHMVQGNSPSLRLQQDGSSGFAPQTWDISGNETNFFIRDVTNSSNLPFRIKPGAPDDSVYIAASGNIGLGTPSPTARLDVRGDITVSNDGNVTATRSATDIAATPVTGNITASGGGNITASRGSATTGGNIIASGGGSLMVTNAGEATVTLSDTSNVGPDLKMVLKDGTFRLSFAGTGDAELELFDDGNMIIPGNLITTGGGGACTVADPCDAVFDPEIYQVPSIEEHAAAMWEDKHLPAVGPTGPGIPVNVSQKLLRMLNELETAHIYIEQLNTRMAERDAADLQIEQLTRRISELETRLQSQ